MAFCVPEHYEKHVELNHPDGKLLSYQITYETSWYFLNLANLFDDEN